MTTSHAHRGTTAPTETRRRDRVRRDVPSPQELQRAVGAAIRDLIRHDPELWRRVQVDPALWHTFGFADPPPAADEEPGLDRA